MIISPQKTVQAYLNTKAARLLDELTQGLMLSKSAVIRLAIKKLHTSSKDDLCNTYNKRLAS